MGEAVLGRVARTQATIEGLRSERTMDHQQPAADRRPTAANYRVRLIRDEASLSVLERLWTDLVANSPAATVFSTFQWNAAWWHHFARGKRLRLLTVWKVSGQEFDPP